MARRTNDIHPPASASEGDVPVAPFPASWISRQLARVSGRIEPEPVHDLERRGRNGDARWVSIGSDPQFILRGDFRRGWNELTFLGGTVRGAGKMSLYFPQGGAFREQSRIELGIMSPSLKPYTRYFHLLESCEFLRLDPMEGPGEFQFEAVEIRSIRHPLTTMRLATRWLKKTAGAQGVKALLKTAQTASEDALRNSLHRMLSGYSADDLRADNDWDVRATYARYVKKTTPTREELRAMAAESERLEYKPVFSIVVPVYNVAERWLTAMIDSVRSQTYPYWELCLANDASTQPHVREVLERFQRKDPDRIKVVHREKNGHISAATNSAMELATGDYYVLVDNDDVVTPDALYHFAKKLNEDRTLDMIYSDEDKITVDGERYEPFFKPDFSPEYLESAMFTAHLACYRKHIADELGGFRSEVNGAQDYDFVLRFTEKTDRIAHLRRVLYHWRAIPGSTASSMGDKSYVVGAGVRALEGRLQRTKRSGTVRMGMYAGGFDVRTKLKTRPKVSIILPSAGRDAVVRKESVDLLANCVTSLRDKATYSNVEIIVVHNGDLRAATKKAVKAARCELVHYDEPVFNISKKINLGAEAATGDYLLILNDDVELIAPDFIEAMLEQGMKKGVGVVGAKLLYENGSIQHAGVSFWNGLPDHVRRHFPRNDPGYMFSTVAVRNYLAVTGACMLTRASLFRKLHGYDPVFPVNYNDIDYCLRAVKAGSRVVYTPHAELYHYESQSRPATVGDGEIELFLKRWEALTNNDPFYNADVFDTHPPDFQLRRDL